MWNTLLIFILFLSLVAFAVMFYFNFFHVNLFITQCEISQTLFYYRPVRLHVSNRIYCLFAENILIDVS